MDAKDLFKEIDELEQAINEECAMDISGVASDLALHLVQEHNYHKQITCTLNETKINNRSYWKCSNCGTEQGFGENCDDNPKDNCYITNFCANCGAKIIDFICLNKSE